MNQNRVPEFDPLFQAWVQLFGAAQSRIEIVSYHWGLQKGSCRGKAVFDTLVKGLVMELFSRRR